MTITRYSERRFAMYILIIRIIILYLLVMICLRLMGKQQIGQLQPFEFVAALMISELATIPMEDVGAPLYTGVVPVIVILVLQTGFGYLSLKSNRFRRLLSGAPTIVIKDGRILEKELAKSRYNLNDLLEQLRIKDSHNLDEVAYAILETNGELSVIPKAEYSSVTLSNMQITPPPTVYPAVLILDGQIQEDTLRELNLTTGQVMHSLQAYDIHLPEDALLAIMNTQGQIIAQKKEARS